VLPVRRVPNRLTQVLRSKTTPIGHAGIRSGDDTFEQSVSSRELCALAR
jgi:hypothetical protein